MDPDRAGKSDNAAATLIVRPYDGTPAEAAEFVNAVWAQQFPDAFTTPQWDADYFAWRQFGQDRHIQLGAYLDGKLVGYVFGEGLALRWQGRPVRAMFSTTLAVDPALKGQGVAKALASRLAQAMREQELAFVYGFAVPGSGSLGPKFWQRSQGAPRGPGIRPFIRPLDAKELARSAGTGGERLAARLAAPLRLDRVGGSDHPAIRRYRPEDLPACLALLREAEAGSDLRVDWSEELLAHELDHAGTPTTLVFEDNGTLRGFINFHRIRFLGRRRFSAGMIDHAVGNSSAVVRALLGAALRQMKSDGFALATCPTSAAAPLPALLAHGFLPLPNRYDTLFAYIGPEFDPAALKRINLHLG